MIANLLRMLVRSKVKRQWAFSNMLRGQLMGYINLYSFLNDPEKTWREKKEVYKREMQLSIFQHRGLVLEDKNIIPDFR